MWRSAIELTIILYRAQVAEFRKHLGQASDSANSEAKRLKMLKSLG